MYISQVSLWIRMNISAKQGVCEWMNISAKQGVCEWMNMSAKEGVCDRVKIFRLGLLSIYNKTNYWFPPFSLSKNNKDEVHTSKFYKF